MILLPLTGPWGLVVGSVVVVGTLVLDNLYLQKIKKNKRVEQQIWPTTTYFQSYIPKNVDLILMLNGGIISRVHEGSLH